MKLIIDIPDWKYKSICEGIEASKRCGVVGIDPDVHEAIYKGIPYEERPQGELKQLQEVKNICEHWNDKSSSFVSACEAFEKILDVMKGGAEE